jgi:hypothetical protein
MTLEEYRARLIGPVQSIPLKLSCVIVLGFSVIITQFGEEAVVTSLAPIFWSHPTFTVLLPPRKHNKEN